MGEDATNRKRRESWNAFSSSSPSGHQFGAPVIRASRSQTKPHGFTYYDLHPCPLPSPLFLSSFSSRRPRLPSHRRAAPSRLLFCLFPSLSLPLPLTPPSLFPLPPRSFSFVTARRSYPIEKHELPNSRDISASATSPVVPSVPDSLSLSLVFFARSFRGNFRRPCSPEAN